MALTKRVEVLFDPDEYRLIEQTARARGEPVAALVRRAVMERYLQPDLEGRRQAVHDLLGIRSEITWEEAKKVIETDTGRGL